MSPTETQLAGNRLLSAAPRHELQRLQADLRLLELTDAKVLNEPGSRIHHAYFPIAGCIALSSLDESHPGLEVGLIGHEGMFGASLVLGIDVSGLRAVVERPTTTMCIDAASFESQLQQCPGLQRVLKHYIQVLMGQLAQNMVCNRFHSLGARLARLLLMICDRERSTSFRVTQQALGRRLGVRRAGVTAAATEMQSNGAISYHRGNINILDRNLLLNAACNCFAADNATYSAMLKTVGVNTGKRGAAD